MADSEVRSRTRALPARVVILLLGLVYLVLSVVGMFTTGWNEFGWDDPVRVFGVFGASTLLNIAHGIVGLVAVFGALAGGALAFAPVLGVAFTAMSAFGIVSRIVAGEGDPFNLTWWNVALYLLSAAACAFVYFSQVRETRTRR